MNTTLFYEWLELFNAYISTTAERRVVLLIDNASCNGRVDDLPELSNVEVVYLPKRTTSRIQPLDAGIIACLKRRYRRNQILSALNLMDTEDTKNLYKVDILKAIRWINEEWENQSETTIYNCWCKTGLVGHEEHTVSNHSESEKDEVDNLYQQICNESQAFNVEDVFFHEDEDNCMGELSHEHFIDTILK